MPTQENTQKTSGEKAGNAPLLLYDMSDFVKELMEVRRSLHEK